MIIYCSIFLFLTQLSSSQDCSNTNTIQLYLNSDINTDIVDSSGNFLKKAVALTKFRTDWPEIDATRIWNQENNMNTGTFYFSFKFYIIGIPKAGVIVRWCDDLATTHINGVDINCGEGNHKILISCDILKFLRAGANYVLMSCNNGNVEGGLAYNFSIESQI